MGLCVKRDFVIEVYFGFIFYHGFVILTPRFRFSSPLQPPPPIFFFSNYYSEYFFLKKFFVVETERRRRGGEALGREGALFSLLEY
jgi:hypothetical protein